MKKYKQIKTETEEVRKRREYKEAHEDGYRAYQDGKSRNDNPHVNYVDGRDDHKVKGWDDGHSDAGWDD